MPLSIVRLPVRRLGPAYPPNIFVLKFTLSFFLTAAVSLVLPQFGAAGALGQEGVPTQSTKKQEAGSALTVGSYQMLKASGTALTHEGGQNAVLDDVLYVRVEQVDGDRVRVASTIGNKQGWLRAEEIVSVERAMDYFNQAIAKDAKNADAYWRRGCLWTARFDHDHALADFDEAIWIAPEHARFYVDRSGVLGSKKQIDRALADCDKAIQLDPKMARAHLYRAIAWVWKQDPKRAEADYDEAVKLDPTDWMYWDQRAQFWINSGNLDKALAGLSEATQAFPQNANPHLLRGSIHLHRNRTKRLSKTTRKPSDWNPGWNLLFWAARTHGTHSDNLIRRSRTIRRRSRSIQNTRGTSSCTAWSGSRKMTTTRH